jgi:hypothetical protein
MKLMMIGRANALFICVASDTDTLAYYFLA